MSIPFQQQQLAPPAAAVYTEASRSHGGSVGPVIAVLAVIAVLGVFAGILGRLCSGRTVMGYGGRYDLEGWFERKCASCIDGRTEAPPPRPRHHDAGAEPPPQQPAERPPETPAEA